MPPSDLSASAFETVCPQKSNVNVSKRKTNSITAMNSTIGTSLQIVPTTFRNAACFTPRSTRKFMSQITQDPPMIDGMLLPCVNVPGKK